MHLFIIKNQTELHMEVGWEYRKLILNVEWEWKKSLKFPKRSTRNPLTQMKWGALKVFDVMRSDVCKSFAYKCLWLSESDIFVI